MPSSSRPVAYMTATEKPAKVKTNGKPMKKKERDSLFKPKIDSQENWRMSMTGILFGGPRVVPKNEDWNKMWNDRRKAAKTGQSKPKREPKPDHEVYIVYEEDDEICESDISVESDMVVLTSGSEADSEPESESEPLPPKEKKKQYHKPAAPAIECLKKKAAKGPGNKSEVVCVKKHAKQEKANHVGNGKQVIHPKNPATTKHQRKKVEKTDTESKTEGTETESLVEMNSLESDSESDEERGKKVVKKAAPKPVVKKVGFAESSPDNSSDSPEPESSYTEGEASSGSSKSTAVEISGEETSEVESSEAAHDTKIVKSGKNDKNGKDGKNSKGEETIESNGQSNSTQPSKNWTSGEDAQILSMKAGGETWANISKKISRGKKEVQKRWKELNTMQGTTAIEGNNDESEPPTEDKADDDKASSKKDTTREPATGNGKKASSPKKKIRINSSSSSSISSSVERARQRRHIYGAALASQVDAEKLDERWTASDNETLGLLEAQRTAGRWLELQARFYNATGRMVPVAVLRRRVREAEKEERGTRDGAAGGSGSPSDKGGS